MTEKKYMFAVLFMLSVCFQVVNVQQTIAIIGSNDIHGSAFPTTLFREDTKEQYLYGGLVYMARLIQIIQSEYPGNNIYLDAGDQFQGGIQSSKLISSGQIMNDFYNAMGLEGSAIGNHEFDFGPDFLFPYMTNKMPGSNLAANLRSEKGDMQFLPNQESSKIHQFASGIKIGIIGLVTLETPSSTSGFADGSFPSYQFLQYKRFVEDESYKLKRLGVNAVLILSHVGDLCYGDQNYRKNWQNTTQQDSCTVDEMTKLIQSLEPGTVDGVIQGHRHRFVHHFINNVPYMGVINGGYYFNVMYLTFDDNKKIINKTIQGPIPVCEKVFEKTGKCNYLTGDDLADAGELISWKFHEQQVYPQEEVNNLFETKWRDKMAQYLVNLAINQVQLYKVKDRQSQLGNLITSLIHEVFPTADFVLINPGLFRTTWIPGVLQYQHYYGMFPFDNYFVSFDITGSQLLEMIKIIQSGTKGFYQFWNIYTEVTYDPDTNQRGFLSAKFMNGTQIQPESTYRGVTIDFLINGGDDFKDVINKIYTPRNTVNQGDFKKTLQPKLIQLQTIKANTWIDPANPRIKILPPTEQRQQQIKIERLK